MESLNTGMKDILSKMLLNLDNQNHSIGIKFTQVLKMLSHNT